MTAPLRSPNRIQNTFANESFMDELAHAAGAIRSSSGSTHLQDPRLIAVTQAAAKMANWKSAPAASKIGTAAT